MQFPWAVVCRGRWGSGSSPGRGTCRRGVLTWSFQEGPASLSELGELGGSWVFSSTFLGSVFGTEGWHRPQKAADSHLRETDKESAFCQQNPAQLPQNRRGEEEEQSGERTGTSRASPWRRRDGEASAGTGADPELFMAAVEKSQCVLKSRDRGLKGWKPSFLLLWPANLPGEAGGSCGFAGKALAGPVSAKLLGLVGQDLALVLCGAVSCRAQA